MTALRPADEPTGRWPWPAACRDLLLRANQHLARQEDAQAYVLLVRASKQQLPAQLRLELLRHLTVVSLRLGQISQARTWVTEGMSIVEEPPPDWLERMAWCLNEHWWRPIVGRRVRLRRPDESDAFWLKSIFADAAFSDAVNKEFGLRLQRMPVPHIARQMRQQLEMPPTELSAWLLVVENVAGGRIGLASIANLNEPNRHGEFILGFPGESAASWLVLETGVLLANTVFTDLAIHKLTVSVYSDNPRLCQLSDMLRQLGFEAEGILKQHIRVAPGRFVDLHLWGGTGPQVLKAPAMTRYAKRFQHKL